MKDSRVMAINIVYKGKNSKKKKIPIIIARMKLSTCLSIEFIEYFYCTRLFFWCYELVRAKWNMINGSEVSFFEIRELIPIQRNSYLVGYSIFLIENKQAYYYWQINGNLINESTWIGLHSSMNNFLMFLEIV